VINTAILRLTMHPNLRTITHTPLRTSLAAFRRTPVTRHLSTCPHVTRHVASALTTTPLRTMCTTSPLLPSLASPHASSSRIPVSCRQIATTATAPTAMFSHPAPEPGSDFNVVMVGAGVSGTVN
jgi:hypothetical protein